MDTREKRPLWRKGRHEKLVVGDYSTSLLKGIIHVERKSPDDLYGSIVQEHARFAREIARAREHGILLVVFVECSFDVFVGKQWSGAAGLRVRGETLGKIVRTMEERYVKFVWCDSRAGMKRLLVLYFSRMEDILLSRNGGI